MGQMVLAGIRCFGPEARLITGEKLRLRLGLLTSGWRGMPATTRNQ